MRMSVDLSKNINENVCWPEQGIRNGKEEKAAMNLSMIAKLAGVSVSTASKAFAGSREISAETRERIFQIARENGCFDKYIKSKYKKKVIAVIYPELP